MENQDTMQVSTPKQISSNTWVVWSIVFAVISLFLFPPIFGGFGIYFGYRAMKAGSEGVGIAMMVICTLFLCLGMFIGAISMIF